MTDPTPEEWAKLYKHLNHIDKMIAWLDRYHVKLEILVAEHELRNERERERLRHRISFWEIIPLSAMVGLTLGAVLVAAGMVFAKLVLK